MIPARAADFGSFDICWNFINERKIAFLIVDFRLTILDWVALVRVRALKCISRKERKAKIQEGRKGLRLQATFAKLCVLTPSGLIHFMIRDFRSMVNLF